MGKPVKYRNPFLFSLLFHVFILTALIVSFEFSSQRFVVENNDKNTDVVNATMITESKIEMPNPSPVPPIIKREPIKKIIPPKPIIKPAPKIPVQTKKEVKLPLPEKTIAIEDKQKKQRQKDLIQQQLLTDLQKQTEKKTKRKEKELQQAFEKELKTEAAKSLEHQLLNEQKRLSNAQAGKLQGIIDKYKALILQAIAQHWLVPNGADKKLSSELLIRVAAGGTVLDVQIVKSSGDDALDRSARSAVFKASPLPVPTDADELEPFRQFILKVKPENVLVRDNGLS